MRLYRTTCALSSDDGLCVEMGVSGGGRVAVAVGQRPSVRLNRITRTSKEPPFRTTQTVMGFFDCYDWCDHSNQLKEPVPN